MQLKNKILLLTALLLGGFFLQSCSDEDENTPSTNTTNPSGCYVTQEVIDDGEEIETITYVYNDNNIISASSVVGTGTPSTTTFEYDGNRIVTATDIQNIYEFKYSGNNSIPSRIDVKEGTEITGYYVIQSSGSNVNEFEEHDLTSGDDIIESTTTFEYDSRGNMSKVIASELDENTEELVPLLTFEGSVYDGKINPYNSSFVFFFMDPGNPSKVGKENLVSGQLNINGLGDLPLAASYEYNNDQYPTSVSLTVPGLITQNTTITYDCK